MKISVILPVYNAEKYISKSIESILRQTFEDFELIIINDGSKDNSLNIINKFTDRRILLVDQENRGLAKTLNIGLDIAKGEYIARMDADDIALPNRFEEQMNYLTKYPEVGLLGSAIELIDENDKHISYHAPYIGHDILLRCMQNKGNPFKHPTVIFKREIAIKLGGFNENIGKYFEDYFLWYHMASKVKVDNLPKVLLKYRITPGSIMTNMKDAALDQFVLDVINKKEFTEEDKKKMDNLVNLSRRNGVNQRRKRNIKLDFFNRIIDVLYFFVGNSLINTISRIKSKR